MEFGSKLNVTKNLMIMQHRLIKNIRVNLTYVKLLFIQLQTSLILASWCMAISEHGFFFSCGFKTLSSSSLALCWVLTYLSVIACLTYAYTKHNWVWPPVYMFEAAIDILQDVNLHLVARMSTSRLTCWCTWLLWCSGITMSS